MTNELIETNEQIKISEINGRTEIVFKKAILKGKVSQADVLNTLLVAAKMQGEYYIKKLSRGAPLEPNEVKCLKDLAEIAKLQVDTPQQKQEVNDTISLNTVKSNLYAALAEKLNDPIKAKE